uniref:SUEL-type lectin domain-containing protein n=1 Tax=Pundamilia nyererei TaxID=303518 RepID=A0A3B4GTF6_9CICH
MITVSMGSVSVSGHSVTCGGSQSNLQCGDNTASMSLQVIVVSWANYGRRDKTTCPDGPLHLLSASADSPFTCIHRCNWQNSCTVEAPSSVDPCHGTYEYLEVFFTCQGKLLKQ